MALVMPKNMLSMLNTIIMVAMERGMLRESK